jgi:hypothetical protein
MKFNELYLSLDDDQQELYFALSEIIHDEEVIQETIKLYRLGKAQDLLCAEMTLLKTGSFTMVDNVIKSNIKKRASARPKFDTKLRKALIKANKLPDLIRQYEAHHIVAKDAKLARRAQEILFALGIDLDDPVNGVFLPKTERDKHKGTLKKAYVHGGIHTKAYYANVNLQIIETYENSVDKENMKRTLRDIADELQKGTYPIYHYLPGAEDFA